MCGLKQDGEEVLPALREAKEPYDLIMMDVEMRVCMLLWPLCVGVSFVWCVAAHAPLMPFLPLSESPRRRSLPSYSQGWFYASHLGCHRQQWSGVPCPLPARRF